MEKDIVNIGKSVVIKGELNGSEDLTIEEARSSPDSGAKQVKGSLALKLQTLPDSEGYWLDTGILRQS